MALSSRLHPPIHRPFHIKQRQLPLLMSSRLLTTSPLDASPWMIIVSPSTNLILPVQPFGIVHRSPNSPPHSSSLIFPIQPFGIVHGSPNSPPHSSLKSGSSSTSSWVFNFLIFSWNQSCFAAIPCLYKFNFSLDYY